MEKLVKFEYIYEGEPTTVFAKFNTVTREIRLPSGYILPVMDNGYIYYMEQTVQVTDLKENPV